MTTTNHVTLDSSDFDLLTLENAPYGVILLDHEGIVRLYNHAEERLSGRKRDDVLGRNFFSDVAPCTRVTEFEGRFRQVVGKPGKHDIFHFHYAFPGKPRDVRIEMYGFTVNGQSGAIVLTQDITNLLHSSLRFSLLEKLNEIAVRIIGLTELKPLLQQIVEDAATLIGLDNCCIHLLKGDPPRLKLAAMTHRIAPIQKVSPVDLERSPAAREALESGRQIAIDDARGHAGINQELRTAYGIMSVLYTPLAANGVPLGILVLHHPRPHAWTQVEIETVGLLAAQASLAIEKTKLIEELQKAKDEYTRLVASLPSCIFVFRTAPDGGWSVDFMSSVIESLLGHPVARFHQADGYEFFLNLVHEEDRSDARDAFTNITQQTTAYFQCRKKCGDGSWRWVECRMNRSTGTDPETMWVNGILTDITEVKTLTEKLRATQKLESIGTLAGGIAHDFNNLLGSITGYASLAVSRYGDQQPLRRYLETIQTSAQRGANLTSQLLAFSRQKPPIRGKVDLPSIIDESALLLRSVIPSNIDLVVDLSKNLWKLHADEGQVQQILINLCTNARDAMPDGGRLTIRADNAESVPAAALSPGGDALQPTADRFVCLSVSDTGGGIPEDVVQRIFDPFFTTKEVGKGTGLGLAIVYGIVGAHRGRLKVSSTPGRGTRISVWLPTFSAEPDAKPAADPDAAPPEKSVLIVEDDPAINTMIAEILASEDIAVHQAYNGLEALDLYRQHRASIKLVLLDLIMPQMDGLATFRNLRELNPTLQVIVATGYDTEERITRIMAEGARHTLRKPFNPMKLIELVREVLDE